MTIYPEQGQGKEYDCTDMDLCHQTALYEKMYR